MTQAGTGFEVAVTKMPASTPSFGSFREDLVVLFLLGGGTKAIARVRNPWRDEQIAMLQL